MHKQSSVSAAALSVVGMGQRSEGGDCSDPTLHTY